MELAKNEVKLSKIIQLVINTSLITRAIYIPLNISINFKLVTAISPSLVLFLYINNIILNTLLRAP